MKMRKGWILISSQGDELPLTDREYQRLKLTPWGKGGFKNWNKRRAFILS